MSKGELIEAHIFRTDEADEAGEARQAARAASHARSAYATLARAEAIAAENECAPNLTPARVGDRPTTSPDPERILRIFASANAMPTSVYSISQRWVKTNKSTSYQHKQHKPPNNT